MTFAATLSDALGGEALEAEWSKDRWFSSASAGEMNACYHYNSLTGNFYPQRIPALVAIDYLAREVLPAALNSVGEDALGAALSSREVAHNHLEVHSLAELAQDAARALRTRASEVSGAQARRLRLIAAFAQRVYAAAGPTRRIRSAPVRTVYEYISEALVFLHRADSDHARSTALEMMRRMDQSLINANRTLLAEQCGGGVPHPQ